MLMTGGFVQEHANAGHAGDLRPQRFDDLVGRERAFRPRLQLDLQPAAVGRRPATARTRPIDEVTDFTFGSA